MPLTLWDLGSLLAILAILLLSSSLLLKGKSVISTRRLDMAANTVGFAFLGVALYLMWEALA